MKCYQALKNTMRIFSIKPVDIVKQSGVTKSRLSRFLAGGGMTTDGLDSILESFEEDTFAAFLNEIASSKKMYFVREEPLTLSEQVRQLNQDEFADLLQAVSQRMRTSAEQKRSLNS